MNGLKTKATKENYPRMLKYYLEFLGAGDGQQYSVLLDPNKNPIMIEADIKEYLVSLRKNGLSYESAKQYLNPIKKFYYLNSEIYFVIRWDRINDYLGEDDSEGDGGGRGEEIEDRAYTREELQKCVNGRNPLRAKIAITLMCSSGIRHGAIPPLKLKNLTKIDVRGGLYKINIYRKKHRYIVFCSNECAKFIDSYLNKRKYAGEELND